MTDHLANKPAPNSQHDGDLCFKFTLDGAEISAYGSKWSGKETVYLNNEIISSKRSFRRSSKHFFEHNGDEHCIHFNVTDILAGGMLCELYRNGKLIDSKVLNAYGNQSRNSAHTSQGYWFYFKVDNADIAVHNSWLGRETVYINDEIISSRFELSFSRYSKHCFEYKSQEYCVHLHLTNLWIGKIECELNIDGVHIDTQNRAFEFYRKKDGTIDIKKTAILLLPPLIIGGVFGFMFASATLKFF